MRFGARKLLAIAGSVSAASVLVVTAWFGTTVQLIVVATLLLLGLGLVIAWLVLTVERRILRALRNVTPVVHENVRRIEVIQPEAHFEQLVRTLHASTARLEAGQHEVKRRIDELHQAQLEDAQTTEPERDTVQEPTPGKDE